MKIYIAGKITGLDNYRELFQKAESIFKNEGHAVMNPSILPDGFEHREYMHICYSMINVCDGVHFLDNWKDSKGAIMEYEYAVEQGKFISFENKNEHNIFDLYKPVNEVKND